MFASDLRIPYQICPQTTPLGALHFGVHMGVFILRGWDYIDYITKCCHPSGPLTKLNVQNLIYHEIEGFPNHPIFTVMNFWADQWAIFCENVGLLTSQLTVACIKCTPIGQK